MHRLTLITLSVLLLATIAGAQDPEQPWDNLRSLGVGEKIQVVDQKLKSLKGTVVSFSDEAITFQAGKDTVTIQRADVFRVSSRKGMSRGKRTLIGMAIGAAAGTAVGASIGASYHEKGETPVFLLVAVPIGVAAGAVGGALSTDRPTIYRAERRQYQTAP